MLANLFGYLRRVGTSWAEDEAAQLGAALAYYALFSTAPLLIIAIAVSGQVFGEAAARGNVVRQVEDYIGTDSATTVQTMLENFRQPPASWWAAPLGVVTMWFGACGMFTQLRSALHRIWRIQPRVQSAAYNFVRTYLFAFLMVLVSSVFVLVLLTASTGMVILLEWGRDRLPGGGWPWAAINYLASLGLLTLLIAFTFRFMSDGTIAYRHVLPGALVSAVLFSLGKLAIGYYLGYTKLGTAYGMAGSLVVFLAWVYYSAQILFVGAEVVRLRIGR